MLRPRTLRLGRDEDAPVCLDDELARLAARQRPRLPEEEDEDAMETVLESHWGDAAPLDQLLTEERWTLPTPGLPDPHTERRERMPVAFITDSIIDERTVEDPATDAQEWRARAIYELNPALPRVDTPDPPPAPIDRPPPPPQGIRTLTPPLGTHHHGIPRLAEWDGSMSPSPPYRDAAPSSTTLPPVQWWDAHLPAIVTGTAAGIILGALYVLIQLA